MSQQLMRLRSDGLVSARREGTTVYYRIEKPEVIEVVEALHAAFCPPGAVRARNSPRRKVSVSRPRRTQADGESRS